MTKRQKNKIIREFVKYFQPLLDNFCEMPAPERLKAIEACRENAKTETNNFKHMLFEVCAKHLPDLHESIAQSEVSE